MMRFRSEIDREIQSERMTLSAQETSHFYIRFPECTWCAARAKEICVACELPCCKECSVREGHVLVCIECRGTP